MNGILRRFVAGLAIGSLGLTLVVGPVAASGIPVQYWASDSYTVDHDCGIVEATTVTVHETAFFDGDQWVRSVVRFDFSGVYTGPTGKTYANETHQNGIFTPSVGQLSGQGSFLRGAGGVLVMDAGRLVFDPSDGSTILASAKVLRFDDPDAGPSLDAALCAELG
jgi:hypothetical protein